MLVTTYNEQFDEALRKLDADGFTEMRFHEDVLPDSVFIAEDAGNLLAFSYLLAGQEFLVIREMPDLPCYSLNLVLSTETADARVLSAVDALFQANIDYLERLRGLYPGRQICLRIWVDARSQEYLEYVKSYGFTEARRMLRMERETAELDSYPDEDPLLHPPVPVTDVTEKFSDPAFMASYIDGTKEAFGFPDSPSEMHFRIRYGGARVYTIEEKSFVTVWDLGNLTMATENVFTREAFRRQGYARKLLTLVNKVIEQRGFHRARLTVYEDAIGAIRLYEALGYQKTAVLLEMHL